ncbi:MAG: sigma-54-dependent Fis family transcriptional regulator [Kiritimatiellae bacterium]|nr:sigma-54-dependent Fis family transcriptional regulator [Kiritimatiellia bacterium]
MTKTKILIADDEKPTRDVLARALGRNYECLTAPDAEIALETLKANPDIALLVSDVRMPGLDGVELVKKARSAHHSLACLVLTAYGSIDLAVAAMKAGAADFVQKPITDLDAFEIKIGNLVHASSLEKEVAALKKQLSGELENFTGKSPAMENVYKIIRKVAPTGATVLVEGPSGTGKELAAKAIHNLSRRAKGPFVAVECSAFSEDLLKSELFGYEPGSFTGGLKEGKKGCFESAAGGTLFLDEIGEIDQGTQVALLRTLETRSVRRIGGVAETPVDFRLVAATNRDLKQMVDEGKFREDLYYRLNVISIKMPALKDHPEDIALLVSRFLKEYARKNGTKTPGIDPVALRTLEAYSWPGNVRQLRNTVERMIVLSSGAKITEEDLPDEITATPKPEFSPDTTLAEIEKSRIIAALERTGGNKTRAAKMLGISRRTMHRKTKEWGL